MEKNRFESKWAPGTRLFRVIGKASDRVQYIERKIERVAFGPSGEPEYELSCSHGRLAISDSHRSEDSILDEGFSSSRFGALTAYLGSLRRKVDEVNEDHQRRMADISKSMAFFQARLEEETPD